MTTRHQSWPLRQPAGCTAELLAADNVGEDCLVAAIGTAWHPVSGSVFRRNSEDELFLARSGRGRNPL